MNEITLELRAVTRRPQIHFTSSTSKRLNCRKGEPSLSCEIIVLMTTLLVHHFSLDRRSRGYSSDAKTFTVYLIQVEVSSRLHPLVPSIYTQPSASFLSRCSTGSCYFTETASLDIIDINKGAFTLHRLQSLLSPFHLFFVTTHHLHLLALTHSPLAALGTAAPPLDLS